MAVEARVVIACFDFRIRLEAGDTGKFKNVAENFVWESNSRPLGVGMTALLCGVGRGFGVDDHWGSFELRGGSLN